MNANQAIEKLNEIRSEILCIQKALEPEAWKTDKSGDTDFTPDGIIQGRLLSVAHNLDYVMSTIREFKLSTEPRNQHSNE